MSRHHGRFGKVYINGTEVASVESWKLSLKRDREDVTCFGDTNKKTVQGLPEVKGSWTGFWDDSDATPFTAQASETSVYLKLFTDYTNNPSDYAYGQAWIDLEIDTSVKGAVKISGDFSAAGDWITTWGSN